MISVVDLYNMTNQVAKKGTSGYQSVPEWNANLSRSQTEAIELLAPFYEVNEQVSDALAPFVKPLTVSTDSAGVISKPADYVHLVRMSIGEYPCYPISINQKEIIKQSPIRRPSLVKNLYFRYFEDNKIKVLPEAVLSTSITYIRKPASASISSTFVSDADSDYETITAVADLEWPHQLFNLFLYLMVEKLGIEVKENLLVEYSNLGLQKEAIKV